MPLDTSIYQIIKPYKQADPLAAMEQGMRLSDLAKAGKQRERDDQFKTHSQRMATSGQALESLNQLPPEQRAQAYAGVRSNLLKSGLFQESDLDEVYDENEFQKDLGVWRSSPEFKSFQSAALDEEHKKAQIEKLRADASAKSRIDPITGQKIVGSKMLPADKVLSVSEGQRIPTMLEDLRGTLETHKDAFGPVMGRLSSMNPYDETAQTIDAQMRTAAQSFGRFMEGGVLRKEDEEKYRKMFPSLSDDPAVAANKLALVDRMLRQKQAADVKALQASGYDTAAFGQDASAPEVPAVLREKPRNEGVAFASDLPKKGDVRKGFVYMGGDPSKKESWKRAK